MTLLSSIPWVLSFLDLKSVSIVGQLCQETLPYSFSQFQKDPTSFVSRHIRLRLVEVAERAFDLSKDSLPLTELALRTLQALQHEIQFPPQRKPELQWVTFGEADLFLTSLSKRAIQVTTELTCQTLSLRATSEQKTQWTEKDSTWDAKGNIVSAIWHQPHLFLRQQQEEPIIVSETPDLNRVCLQTIHLGSRMHFVQHHINFLQETKQKNFAFDTEEEFIVFSYQDNDTFECQEYDLETRTTYLYTLQETLPVSFQSYAVSFDEFSCVRTEDGRVMIFERDSDGNKLRPRTAFLSTKQGDAFFQRAFVFAELFVDSTNGWYCLRNATHSGSVLVGLLCNGLLLPNGLGQDSLPFTQRHQWLPSTTFFHVKRNTCGILSWSSSAFSFSNVEVTSEGKIRLVWKENTWCCGEGCVHKFFQKKARVFATFSGIKLLLSQVIQIRGQSVLKILRVKLGKTQDLKCTCEKWSYPLPKEIPCNGIRWKMLIGYPTQHEVYFVFSERNIALATLMIGKEPS